MLRDSESQAAPYASADGADPAAAVRALLMRAAADGRRRRARVRRPMMTLGMVCVVVGLPVLLFGHAVHLLFREVAMGVIITGGWFLVCAMVPDDPRSPYYVASFTMTVELVLLPWDTLNTIDKFAEARALCTAHNEQQPECRHLAVMQATMIWDTCTAFIAVAVCVHTFASCWHHGSQPRRTRRRIISLLRYILPAYTMGIAAREVSAALHLRPGAGGATWVDSAPTLVLAAYVLLIALVGMSPGGIERLHRSLMSRGLTEGASSAAVIASLIGGSGRTPAETMDRAIETLRCVSLDRIQRHHLAPPRGSSTRRETQRKEAFQAVVVQSAAAATGARDSGSDRSPSSGLRSVPTGMPSAGASIAPADVDEPSRASVRSSSDRSKSVQSGRSSAGAELSSRLQTLGLGELMTPEHISVPAEFGRIDAFVSHSWSDDPDAKWAALQRWRERFKAIHRREPTIWIDRLCIDEDNIAESLESLPVYLAGCRTMLALVGETYTRRLWCVMELSVFTMTGGEDDQIEWVRLEHVPPTDVGTFDVRQARCTLETDSDRLLSTIEASFEGTEHFNETVRMLLARATSRATLTRPDLPTSHEALIDVQGVRSAQHSRVSSSSQ